MPSLIKKRGSDVWFVRFRHHGQDRVRSTGETDRRNALKHLKTATAEIRLERTVDDRMEEILLQLRRMPDEPREKARLRLLAKLQAAADRSLPLADVWTEWLRVPKQTSPITLAGYEAVWKRFKEWLSRVRPQYAHLAQITEADAKAYSEELWSSKVSPVTYNLHVSFLRRLWTQLKLKAGVTSDVWQDIERQEKRTFSHESLTKEQLVAVIGSANGELRNLLLVGLLTGLRLKDAVHLNASHYNQKTQLLTVTPFKTRRKNKRVTIPVHLQVLPLLKKPGLDGNYFPGTLARYKVDPQSVSKQIQAHFEACGLKTTEMPENGQRKRAGVKYGFHSLRFSFVSLCAASGTPQHVLGAIVGHSSPSMTLHYSQATAEQKHDAVTSLPAIAI